MPSSRLFSSRATVTRALSETGPDNTTVTAACCPAMVTSLIVGSSVSEGNFALATVTLSLTSARAASESRPAINSNVILAKPSPAVAFISFTPSIERNSRSMGLTNIRSASSGEIPSCTIDT